jgi:hypothetical protein
MTSRSNILNAIYMGVKYKRLMSIKKNDPRANGFVFETICILCLITKSLIENYDSISDTKLSEKHMFFKKIKSFSELFNVPLERGDNHSDISMKISGKWSPFSIKYKNKAGKSDLNECRLCMDGYKKDTGEDYSLGYICKDINNLTNHRSNSRPEKISLNIAKKDGYLFDEKDVENAYNKMQEKLMKNVKSKDDIIAWLDKEYLNETRKHLKLYLNQRLALEQFKRNKNESLIHCLNHKPRSGKTIIMLLYAQYLLENGYKRILIMTSVPGTIDSFIEELNKYYEFKGINYKGQADFMSINEEFTGIVFCSVQYLKTGNKKDKQGDVLLEKKKEKLKLFDGDMFDECHFHSSNKNTYDKIINVQGDNPIMKIFVSGTSGKTEYFYNIDKKYIYKWSIEDEAYMKKLFPK